MLSNSEGSVSRPTARTLISYACPSFDGGCPTSPAATCTFCSLQRGNTPVAVKPALRHPRRIEPQPHGVLPLAENDRVADARHALQRVLHVDVEIIAQKQAVVLPVFGINARRQTRTRPAAS